MERFIKLFFKKPSTQRTRVWEYCTNHTDTETYKAHSCFALGPVELHAGICSGVKVIESTSMRAPA